MIWFTADNGAHTGGRPSGQLSATNGLRQCKASLSEGGIRVPGFIHWPSTISKNTKTDYVAITSDFMPTMLDLLGKTHPHPDWKADGASLLPLLRGDLSSGSARVAPLGWHLHAQIAWQEDHGKDGRWKIVVHPNKGQCSDMSAPYNKGRLKGPFLFNLSEDPIEAKDLCKKEKDRCDSMFQSMKDWRASIDYSAVHESQCAKHSSLKVSVATPREGFSLKSAERTCLSVRDLVGHGLVEVSECDENSHWEIRDGNLKNLASDKTSLCLKVDNKDSPCTTGNTIWLGPCEKDDLTVSIDSMGRFVAEQCSNLCGVPATKTDIFTYSHRAVALGECNMHNVFVFTEVSAVVTV